MRLVRAVARREPLPGYAIEAPGATGPGAVTAGELRIVETWRGPRFAAHVLEADDSPSAGTPDAAGLAGTMAGSMDGARVVALWLAAPGTGPGGGRLAVAVTEPASGAGRSGESR